MSGKCDGCTFSRTRTIDVLGKEITVKNYICARDGGEYKEKPANPRYQLSIIPTEYCGCSCPFCSASDSMHGRKIDLKKLEETLLELKKIDIVRGISITGGEPFSDVILLNSVINMVFEILGYDMEVAINTNGRGIKDFDKLDNLKYVDTVHISRHHYDEKRNAELFKGKVPTNDEIKSVVADYPYNDIFVFNCLLLKDYIGTRDEFHRFLDYTIEMGVPKTGFITAMEINDFTRRQRISYEDIISEGDEQILFTKRFTDFDICRCQDGVYTSRNGGICEFYGRQTLPGTREYVRGFVFGADNHLRTGYGGEIIR